MSVEVKNKIIFILPSLKAGGAERVISFIAKKLHQKSYNIKLIVIGFKIDKVYDLDGLDVEYLNKRRLLTSIYSLFYMIITEKPKIVFSSISHVNILMSIFSIFFRRTNFIAREASVMSEMKKFSNKNSRIKTFFIRWLYPQLDLIICQSEDMYMDIKKQFNFSPSKLKIINNPITSNYIPLRRGKDNSNIINFVTVGRLSKEKGHIRLLQGLSHIKLYNFKYSIVGSGPELIKIKSFCKTNSLLDKIQFIPYTKKVLEELLKNDIFLQGSYVEGFPNSLLESCSVGTPVIAFNAIGGTKEIVIEGTNGYIVKNMEEFVQILNDKNKLLNFDFNQIINSVYEKFSSKKILLDYEKMFNSMLID